MPVELSDGLERRGRFFSTPCINRLRYRRVAFFLLFPAIFACCGGEKVDVNNLDLRQAKEREVIYQVCASSEGLQGAVLVDAYDSRLGFYDVAGKLVIPFDFYPASDEEEIQFSGGLAPAATKSRLAGYIDAKGEWVVKPQFNYAASFHGGIAYVSGVFGGSRKTAYLKPDGSFFIKPEHLLEYYYPPDGICIFRDQGKKFGLCRPDGKVIVEPIYDQAISVFEGRALLGMRGKYGFLDAAGKPVTKFEYDDARNFIGGTAIVEKRSSDGRDYYGVIDTSGQYLIPLRSDIEIGINPMYNALHIYEHYFGFEPWLSSPIVDGVFSARLKSSRLYGLMNLKGEWVLRPNYKALHYIGNKLFSYITEAGVKGTVGTDGSAQ